MLVDNHEIAQIGQSRAALRSIWNQKAYSATGQHIDRFDPDVVHVHTPFPLMSPSVFVAASRHGRPVVATSHSFRYSCVNAILQRDGQVCEDCVGRRFKYPAMLHRCYKSSLPGSVAMSTSLTLHGIAGTFTNRVDRFIALTPFMRDRLVAEGINTERVSVLPNAAPDPGPRNHSPGGPAVFVGRFSPEKGVRTILRAWEELEADIPLVFAGDGILRAEIEAAAAVDPRITVLPWLDPAAVTELLARAEVMILASEWFEGLNLVIPESFAVGTPIIASDIGNFSELIDPGRTGDRFRSADAVDLVRCVRWIFEEADRASLRANARADYESTYTPERQLDDLETIYCEVIAERAARS
jgi:glycosyltransferase involved in cell wall biosynthesis